MSEEIEMTPITPEEGGVPPPKVTPAAAVGAASAPTVKLKPVIRKPMIRKPVIGGAKPVALKPAVGTPPPPAAVPEAAAPKADAEAKPAAAPQLKSITSPIAAQAILRKTGIVAEGILTPAQAQAAKTKTSRISLESAIGVAPAMKSAAPMKTIKLRRPTDIPPAPGAIKPAGAEATAPTPLKPAAPAEPAGTAAPAEPSVTAATTVAAEPKPAALSSPATTTTQKKTLKLQRPGFKRPTVSGLRRPGSGDSASGAAPATQPTAAPGGGDVADLSTVADIPDIKPLPVTAAAPAEDDSGTVAGAPAWLNVTTLIAGIAALVVIGLCTWTLFREAVGPAAGPNDLASFQSDTDYRR